MLKTRLNQFLASLLVFLLALLAFQYKSPQFVLSATDHVVISEIQIAGATSTDEFIELYNPTDQAVDVTNWRLAKKTAAVDAEEVDVIAATMSGTIQPHGYFLIAHSNYDGSVSEDITYSGPESYANNNTILLYDDTNTPVDKVGLDTASDNETEAFPSNPTSNRSIERKAQSSSTVESMGAGGDDELFGNGEDTDNNANDFVYRTTGQGADPQNSASATEMLPEPTPEPTPTETPEPSPSEEPTPTPEPSVSPEASPSPDASPEVSPTPLPSASPEVSPSATPEPTVSPSPEASVTPEPSPSEEPEVSPTPEPSTSATPEPSVSPSPSPSHEPQVIFSGLLFRCTLTYRTIWGRFFRIEIPHISCERI